MIEATFNELFVHMQPHMQDCRVNHDGLRSYSKRHGLLLILSYLAHVPTMRCSWRMYQQSKSRQVYCFSVEIDNLVQSDNDKDHNRLLIGSHHLLAGLIITGTW